MGAAPAWHGKGKIWIGIALGAAICGACGALAGWRRPPHDSTAPPEIAQQISQLQELRDGARRELGELQKELAEQAAAAANQQQPGVGPEPEPPPSPASAAASDDPSRDLRLAAVAALRKSAEEALEAGEVDRAVALLQQAAAKAGEPEGSQIEGLLEQARQALPQAVLAKLQVLIADADNDQIEHWIASGKPPPAWAQDFSSPQAANAFRKAAAKLLPIAWHNREQPYLAQRALRHLGSPSPATIGRLTPFYIFRELTQLQRQGRLNTDAMREVSDVYGAYGAERLLHLVRGLLVSGIEPDAENAFRAVPLTDRERDAVRGNLDPLSCAALLERCRQMAPASFQPIDAPHPLAGRWRGKLQWQIYVDIPHDKVTYVRKESNSELTLGILKIGADHLVCYAPKIYVEGQPVSSAPGFDDPFQFEKLAACDDIPLRPRGGQGVAAGITLFVASPQTKTMDAYRRLTDGDKFAKEFLSMERQPWRELSDVKKYRLFERYRYATAQSSR